MTPIQRRQILEAIAADQMLEEMLEHLLMEHSYAHHGKTECVKCITESNLRIKLAEIECRAALPLLGHSDLIGFEDYINE